MNLIIKSITSITAQVNLDSQINTVKTKTLYSIILPFSFLFTLQHIFAQPTIASFTPTSGEIGATVTLTGTGFNTAPANNIVFFGATQATVSAATATSLTLTVPTGATFAPITVLNTATSLAANSTQFFNPTFSPNKISMTAVDMEPKVDFGTGLSPLSSTISDIDGDGKPDLVIVNINSSSVSVLLNTSNIGTVSFAAKVDFIVGNSPVSIAIGDIDRDGKPDLVISNRGSNSVSILRNTSTIGMVSFATRVDFTTSMNPYGVAIGDINGDGKPDLAVVNGSNTGNSVSVFRNTSSSSIISFATKLDFTTGFNPLSVTIGDIDGDSKPDLAVANYNSNTISILRNTTSSSTFVNFAAKVDFTTDTGPNSVSIGDLDGDGKPDLAIANENSNSVSILRNVCSIGTVSFATKVNFTTGTTPFRVAIGDINGDGKPDLVVANSNASTISFIRNTGISGTVSFAAKVDFVTGANPRQVAIGDIDGDGKPDLIMGNGISTVSVLRNNPQPAAPTISSFTPTSGATGVQVYITGTDFNTTPNNNIVFFGATRATVTAATSTSLTVTVPAGATFAPITLLNTGSNLATYSTQFFNPTFNPNKGSITTADMATKVDFGTNAGPNSVAIGDLDGDGKPDLVIANANSYTVSVLRNISNSGTVSFATKVDFTAGNAPSYVAIGDINGDGKPDLAVANLNSNTISILRNTSSIASVSFATKVDFTTGSNPNQVAIGDIDGDGKPDLAIANFSSNNVSMLRNISSITAANFAAKIDFTTGINPRSVTIGDIDGDSKPDLAIANQSSNSVSILHNMSSIGTISFATKVDFGTNTTPRELAIGDLDGDGKPDLAIVNHNLGNTVSVLRNTSNIDTVSFAIKVDFTTGLGHSSVAIGDIDGDGKPDLAIANQNFSSVSILHNTGSIGAVSFATKVDFGTNTTPMSVAIGDIDGDGKPDLAIANYNNNTISVLRNNPQFPPTITTVGLLNPFIACTGKTSAQQTLTVSGIGLTANIVVTVPIGFEVSTTSGSGFGNSVNLTHMSGIVSTTNIFIRLTSSVSGSPSGNIVFTSTGAPTKNVMASGVVNVTSISTSISNISICPSSLPYFWNGRTYNTTKTDTVYLINTLGCDSITILKLTVKQTSTSTNNISICQSLLPYSWNGRTYNAAKTDTVYLTNLFGCDSITILNLTVKPTSTSVTNINICPSSLPYSWNGRTYNAAKTDTIYLTNLVNCDSITILNLTVKSTSTSTNNVSICPSALPYTWNGLTFNTAGTQTKTGLINSVGCDSSATLNLTVKTTSTSTYNINICPSALPYSWNGLTFNTAGTQTKTGLINSVGCDSSATLTLTIKSTSTSTNNVSICPIALPYSWNGLIFNAAGTQTKTGLTNAVGCDSSATLNLTVKPTSTSTNNISICPSALPYSWNGLIFNAAGTQTKTGLTNSVGCDSSATLNLTVNTTPNTSNILGLTNVTKLDTASYSVTGAIGSVFNWFVTGATIQSGTGSNKIRIKWLTTGIDTIKVTETSDLGCVGIQKLLVVNVSPGTGIYELKTNNQIIIYPNPFNETIHITLLNNLKLDKAIIYDLVGNEIISSSKTDIDASILKSGVYLITIVDNIGNSYNQKLIKN